MLSLRTQAERDQLQVVRLGLQRGHGVVQIAGARAPSLGHAVAHHDQDPIGRGVVQHAL